MSKRWTLSFLATAVLLTPAPPAAACSLARPPWEERPWAASDADDRAAPTSAPVISGRAKAPNAAEGCGGGDSDDDPGDCATFGIVEIYIDEHAGDARTAPSGMAYRIEIVEGDAPFPEDVAIFPVARDDGDSPRIWARIRRAKLNARVRVIPVDAGGNEGPPSNTIRLSFDESGCTVLAGAGGSNLLASGLLLSWLLTRRRRRG